MSLWAMLGRFSNLCFPCPKWVLEPPRYWLFGYKLISHLSLKRFWFHQTERQRLNSSCFQQMCIWIACAEKKAQPDLGLPAQCSVHWNSGFCWRSVSFLFTAAIKGKEEESLFNKNPFHKTPWKASVINRTQSKTFMSEADRGRRIRNTKPSRSGTPMFSDSQGFDASWFPAEFHTRRPWSQSWIWLRDGTGNGAPWVVSVRNGNFQNISHWPPFLHHVHEQGAAGRDPEESHRPKCSHKQVLLSLQILLLPSLPPKYLPLHQMGHLGVIIIIAMILSAVPHISELNRWSRGSAGRFLSNWCLPAARPGCLWEQSWEFWALSSFQQRFPVQWSLSALPTPNQAQFRGGRISSASSEQPSPPAWLCPPQQCHWSDIAAWPPKGQCQTHWPVMDVVKAAELTRELQSRGCHHMNHWTSCCHCQQLQALDIFLHTEAGWLHLESQHKALPSLPQILAHKMQTLLTLPSWKQQSSSFLREWLSLYLRKQNPFPKLGPIPPRAVQAQPEFSCCSWSPQTPTVHHSYSGNKAVKESIPAALFQHFHLPAQPGQPPWPAVGHHHCTTGTDQK